MKKTFLKFAYVGAIALTGMMGFSACQSDSAEEVNPNYDPETNTVKTEFAFNIVSNAKQKMTATNTQNGGNFLGMNTMRLFCFDQEPADDHFLGMFNLGSLTASSITAAQSSKIYTMYLPVGTSDFLFYGAYEAGTGHENGKLTKTFPASVSKTSDLSEINFALVPIVANNSPAITGVQTTLLGHLNNILKARKASGTTWYGTQWLFATGGEGDATTKEKTKAAYRPLAVAYKTFIDDLQIRQASSTTFLRSLQDLYNVAKTISNGASTTPGATDDQKTDIKAVADDIIAKIEETALFDVTDNGTTTPKYTLAYETAVDATVKNFPMEQGLPAGAAVLTMATTGTPEAATETTPDAFAYTNNGNNVLGQSVANNIFDITYPSELTYYANSKAIVSNGVHAPGDYPKNVTDWDNWTTTGTDDWDKSSTATVTARTQAAAMKNNAKYGVAQLQSTVKLASNTMTDNATKITQTNDVNDYITDVNNQTITFDADDFEWTGILIGGQADLLKYDFTTNNTSNMNKVIYDNVIKNTDETSINITTATSAPNYTLALDNYLGAGDQQTVNVALEIKNNSGKDFYGIDGIIAAGATFYLVGQLDPASADAITWGSSGVYSNHPGYDVNRVFIQDFKTIANFTIPANGLQKAYSSIPDLRSTQMLFGLSVDLTWKSGLTFNVNL